MNRANDFILFNTNQREIVNMNLIAPYSDIQLQNQFYFKMSTVYQSHSNALVS